VLDRTHKPKRNQQSKKKMVKDPDNSNKAPLFLGFSDVLLRSCYKCGYIISPFDMSESFISLYGSYHKDCATLLDTKRESCSFCNKILTPFDEDREHFECYMADSQPKPGCSKCGEAYTPYSDTDHYDCDTDPKHERKVLK